MFCDSPNFFEMFSHDVRNKIHEPIDVHDVPNRPLVLPPGSSRGKLTGSLMNRPKDASGSPFVSQAAAGAKRSRTSNVAPPSEGGIAHSRSA